MRSESWRACGHRKDLGFCSEGDSRHCRVLNTGTGSDLHFKWGVILARVEGLWRGRDLLGGFTITQARVSSGLNP